MNASSRIAPALVAALVLLDGGPAAAAGIEIKRVQFPAGHGRATLEGKIKGDQTIDYLLRAEVGQTMSVEMTTRRGANSFNILPPGSKGEALHIGSIAGNSYSGILPADGDYRIRIYLMRSAARRGERASYTLEVAVTDAAGHEVGPAGDAKVPGTDHHANGSIPCSMGGGQPTGSCPFGVRRRGGGSGTVTVTRPDGRTRSIVFEKGRATGSDASEADPGEFRATREGDLSIVRIGPARHEIPDAVIFGG